MLSAKYLPYGHNVNVLMIPNNRNEYFEWDDLIAYD